MMTTVGMMKMMTMIKLPINTFIHEWLGVTAVCPDGGCVCRVRDSYKGPTGGGDVVEVVGVVGGGVGSLDLSGSPLSVMLAGKHWLIGGPAVKSVH